MRLHMYAGFLLLSWECSLVIGQWMVPCTTNEVSSAGPPLPELPDQFKMNIQASIVQKHYTMNMVEYYDFPNNRAVVERRDADGNQMMRQITDLNTKEVHLLYDNGTCIQKAVNSSSRSFSFMIAKDGAHLKTVKDLLYFGPDKGEVFVDGDKMVRGIAVNHWTTCVSVPKSNGTFTLDYYFSKGTKFTLDGQSVQVPVRAIINGTGHSWRGNGTDGTHSFYHIYDFTDFQSGPIRNPSVFEIPPGTFCQVDEDTTMKPTPTLPKQFSVGMEATVYTPSGDLEIMQQQMYYDDAANVMRIDVDSMGATKDSRRFGNRPVSIIHDMGNSMRYVLDKWEDNCTVLEASPSDNIVTPEDLIMLVHKANTYQGNKTLRGISVESWAGFNKTENTVLDVLFRKTSGKPSPILGQPQRKGDADFYIPVGIFYRTIPSENQPEQKMQVHMYGFSRSHPDPDVFDISPCYELGNHYSFLMINTEGNYARDVAQHKREYIAGVRAAIARGAGVSIMRITSITVEANLRNTNQLNVYFKLLDNSLYGTVNNNLPSLSAAKLNLQSAIAGGINFDVQYPTIEQNFEIVRDSLWVVTSSSDKTPESTIKRYSSASMAGLGIGMVVIGALLGLGAAYLIYKRIDTSVPYQITQ